MAPATIAVTAAAPAQNLALGLFEGWLLNASASGWVILLFIVVLTRMASQPSNVFCAHADCLKGENTPAAKLPPCRQLPGVIQSPKTSRLSTNPASLQRPQFPSGRPRRI